METKQTSLSELLAQQAEPKGGGNLPPPLQAEPVQEPVAWLQPKTVDAQARPDLGYETCAKNDYGAFPVYRAPPKAEPAQEPVACEPQYANDDGWCDWVCPKPRGYLMQCCDCELIHEVESRVAKYQPQPSEEFEVVDDPDLQLQWRMKRRDDISPQRKPLSLTDLQEALVFTNLIDRDAIEDPEEYDEGSTLAQIDELYRIIKGGV